MIRRMKVGKYFILFIVMQIFFYSCGKEVKYTSADVPEKNKTSLNTDCVIFSDEEIKKEAANIVKVQVLDELSSENSLIDYSEEYGMVIKFCAVRSVQALEVYKSDGGLSCGDEFQVQEGCAIYELNGEIYQDTVDDIPPLKKGASYILYMDDGKENMSGKPSILSGENARIELSHEEK